MIDPETRKQFGCAAAELPPDSCRQLLAGLDAIGGKGKPREAPVHDGFPCELLALRRGSLACLAAKLNLAGLPESEAAHPAVVLVKLILDLEAASTGSPRLLMGAADFHGNITIGPT